MENQENQVFTIRSWSFPLFGVALLFGLAFLPIGRSSPEEKVLRARSKAEVLAYQVAQLYRESLSTPADFSSESSANSLPEPKSGGSRSPASIPSASPAEGMMGEDPWGRAYYYRILIAEDGRLRIEMKSAGPDGVLDHNTQDDIHLTLSF
jgi:type II secretory pathway pseudopilin PulG